MARVRKLPGFVRGCPVALILWVLLALTLAPCGPARAAEPSCGMNNGKSASGQPIPIGSINGVTGPDDFSSSAKAADAYFKCVNANGGINGRPVRYIMADDQWRPDVASHIDAALNHAVVLPSEGAAALEDRVEGVPIFRATGANAS